LYEDESKKKELVQLKIKSQKNKKTS